MNEESSLLSHLASGSTTVCRCWLVIRRDGMRLGFTDHDRPLQFDGVELRAESGMTARALQQSTGLSVDNTQAMGALSDSAVTEADIMAGRYDGAEVQAWIVNWQDVTTRKLQFRGTLGEITRSGGMFEAELRGLAEQLNQPQGTVYQTACSALLGDQSCRFDLSLPGYSIEIAVDEVDDRRSFRFATLTGFSDRWFERGRLVVLTGTAAGLSAVIKNDRAMGTAVRKIELWQALGAEISTGDMIRLDAGCDKRSATCREKFNNFLNFRGFPHIPGEDWLTAFPSQGQVNDGGSLIT